MVKNIYIYLRGRLVRSKPQEKSTAASFLERRAEYIIRLERRATGAAVQFWQRALLCESAATRAHAAPRF